MKKSTHVVTLSIFDYEQLFEVKDKYEKLVDKLKQKIDISSSDNKFN